VTAPPSALSARFVLRKGENRESFTLEVSLELEAGVVVLFGPTGAGKTLTLAVLAGLERPSSGFVRLGNDTLFDASKGVCVPPHERGIGYVPQRSSLFPFTDVLGNVSFGLPRARRTKEKERCLALLEELGVAHRASARPDDLSGGERQKVALARALVVLPRLLLLDEPFASIDRAGRASLGKILRDALAKRGVPAVFVTHDPVEAVEMGASLVPMEAGRSGAPALPADFFGPREPPHISMA
jgi:molybdate transport system ATP-binding protein